MYRYMYMYIACNAHMYIHVHVCAVQSSKCYMYIHVQSSIPQHSLTLPPSPPLPQGGDGVTTTAAPPATRSLVQTAAAGEVCTTGVEEEGAGPQHQGAGLEGVALPAAPAEVRRSST